MHTSYVTAQERLSRSPYAAVQPRGQPPHRLTVKDVNGSASLKYVQVQVGKSASLGVTAWVLSVQTGRRPPLARVAACTRAGAALK